MQVRSLGREDPLAEGMEPTPWVTTELDTTKHVAHTPAGPCPADKEPIEPVLGSTETPDCSKHYTPWNLTSYKSFSPTYVRVCIYTVGRSPGEGNGNPLQYPCLENRMDRGAWKATVRAVTRVGQDGATIDSECVPGGYQSCRRTSSRKLGLGLDDECAGGKKVEGQQV